MALDLDLSEDNFRESGDDVAPGKCMVVLSEFKEHGASGTGNHIVDLEIVAHENPDEVGKVHTEFFSQTPKAGYRLRQLAVASGLTTLERMKAAKDAGEYPTIEFNDAVGRPFYVLLATEEYTKRDGTIETSVKIGKGGAAMYRIDDKKYADWPTNESMKARGLKMLPKAGEPTEAPAQQTSAPAPASNEELSPF